MSPRPPRPIYLRTMRERLGLTQVALAHKSGIDQPRISRLEKHRPRRGPDFETGVALAQALGIDPARLRFGPDPTPIRRPRRAALADTKSEPGASA